MEKDKQLILSVYEGNYPIINVEINKNILKNIRTLLEDKETE